MSGRKLLIVLVALCFVIGFPVYIVFLLQTTTESIGAVTETAPAVDCGESSDAVPREDYDQLLDSVDELRQRILELEQQTRQAMEAKGVCSMHKDALHQFLDTEQRSYWYDTGALGNSMFKLFRIEPAAVNVMGGETLTLHVDEFTYNKCGCREAGPGYPCKCHCQFSPYQALIVEKPYREFVRFTTTMVPGDHEPRLFGDETGYPIQCTSPQTPYNEQGWHGAYRYPVDLDPYPGGPAHVRVVLQLDDPVRLLAKSNALVALFFAGEIKDRSPEYAQRRAQKSQELRDRLRALYHPDSCADTPIRGMYGSPSEEYDGGWGSGVLMLGNHVAEMFRKNGILVPMLTHWSYTRGHEGYHWIYENASSCSLDNHPSPENFHTIDANVIGWVFPTPNMTVDVIDDYREFASPFWMGHMLAHITYENERVRNQVLEPAFQMLPFRYPEKINMDICVHIRQGERSRPWLNNELREMPRIQFEWILTLIRRKAKEEGLSGANIFFSSDSDDLMNRARQYDDLKHKDEDDLNPVPLKIFTNTASAHSHDGQDCYVREAWIVGCTDGLDYETTVNTMLVDIALLLDCDHFIGTMRSAFSKTIGAIALGRGRLKSPPISIE